MTSEQLERWRREFRSIVARNIKTLEFYQRHAARQDRTRNWERELEETYRWMEAFT